MTDTDDDAADFLVFVREPNYCYECMRHPWRVASFTSEEYAIEFMMNHRTMTEENADIASGDNLPDMIPALRLKLGFKADA